MPPLAEPGFTLIPGHLCAVYAVLCFGLSLFRASAYGKLALALCRVHLTTKAIYDHKKVDCPRGAMTIHGMCMFVWGLLPLQCDAFIGIRAFIGAL